MWIVAFVLFEPVWNRFYEKEEKPVIALMIDDSKSMSITDADGDRKNIISQLLKSPALKNLSSKYEVNWWKFTDKLRRINSPDSVSLNGYTTDIAFALDELKQQTIQQNLAGVILISDGQYTQGVNPQDNAIALDVPVFAVGIGSSDPPKDLILGDVVFNEVVFAGENIPMDVNFSARGFGGQKAQVDLDLDDKPLLSQSTDIRGDGRSAKVQFNIADLLEGKHRMTIRLPKLPDELTAKNNTRTVYISVLKSKIRVDFISGVLNQDHHFYFRELSTNPKILLKTSLEDRSGNLNEVKATVDYKNSPDIIILHNYPTANSASWNSMSSKITASKTPVLFLTGPFVDVEKINSIQKVFALKADPRLEEVSVFFSPTTIGKNSAILKSSEDPNETQRDWSDLPPVWISRLILQPSKNSEVLARVDLTRASNVLRMKRDLPLIISGKEGDQKIIALQATGFWKSSFVMNGLNKPNDVYRKFISNAVTWLSVIDDSKRIKIQSNKEVFQEGEKIGFFSQVYDESMNPVPDADIIIKIKRGSSVFEVACQNMSNGRYVGEFEGLEAGTYQYEGSVKRNDQSMGSDKGQFIVEEFSPEFVETSMNESLMRSLASSTGGVYIEIPGWESFLNNLKFESRIQEIHKEVQIWNKLVLLFAVVGLLTIEWWLRKRSGLL